MPVELRKRKTPPPAPERPKKKAAPKAKEAKEPKEAPKAKEKESAAKGKNGDAAPPAAAPAKKATASNGAAKKPSVDDTIDLASFGGEVTLNDGTTTTLAQLVEQSDAGVILFTYPKASTPGCTNQACMFRDSKEELTSGSGLAIYGLSRDSPKSNTTFKEKQKLTYPLLCDPKGTLISAIGLSKAGSSTQRGVFAVNKEGKVLLAEPGSPAGTVDAAKKLVASLGDGEAKEEKEDEKGEEKEEEEKADANGDSAPSSKEDEAEKGEEEGKEEEKKEEAEKEEDKAEKEEKEEKEEEEGKEKEDK